MKTEDINGTEFFLAVRDVREDLENKGEKLGQEKWSYSDYYRRLLFDLVRDKYCERTGCKHHDFPFSVDGVSLVNMRWRKESNQQRALDDLLVARKLAQ